MADPLRFHRQFVSDLRYATEWYDSVSAELDNRFRLQVDARFDNIATSPDSFAIAFDDIRFARIHRFPYIIIFKRLNNYIHVLGLFHGTSDPAKWQRRSNE